ncbi:MAG: phage GP46 family protein [Alphaproteobacteria bacterium]|nr:phage GP46 family protein [Alphaproteobacteria bacterium]
MADLKLVFDRAAGRYDLALDPSGQPVPEEGLKSAVIAAVLSWGRAREGDPLPGDGVDRKGHWADPWVGRTKGSRVWLLAGRIITDRTVADAQTYLQEALDPFVVRGEVSSATARAWRSGTTRISGQAILVHFDDSRTVVEFEDLASP